MGKGITAVLSDFICILPAVDAWGRKGMRELGGDRETGLGNSCIFNGTESNNSGVGLSEQLHN